MKTATLSNIDDLDLPSSLKISQPQIIKQVVKNNDFSENKISLPRIIRKLNLLHFPCLHNLNK